MGQRLTWVDAFAEHAYSGNPAAVCVLSEPAEARWMQDVAAELNLSETAFARREDGDSTYRLRWFTPRSEVDLCGHATLATAHVLWEEGHLPPGQEARFETRSGLLRARKGPQGIEMDFPCEPLCADPATPEELALLSGAIPASIRFAGRNRLDFLVELENEDVVRNLRPDIRRLEQLPVRGVIVTSRASARDRDFVSRFFAPRVGVDEDPVCGSAHCCLGPYWRNALGRSELIGHQVSRRGGVVRVRVNGDRVALIGRAVSILRGELI
jgi:predicted PhzF superfamily epimerase YddE/YHI9